MERHSILFIKSLIKFNFNINKVNISKLNQYLINEKIVKEIKDFISKKNQPFLNDQFVNFVINTDKYPDLLIMEDCIFNSEILLD